MNRRFFTTTALATAVALGAAPGAMAQGEQRTVAVMFDSLQSPFWVSSMQAFRDETAERGWEMLENISNLDDSRQFQQVQSMIERGVDGIVIVQTDSNAVIPAIRAANEAGIPMVHYNRPPAESDTDSVAVIADNRAIMRATVEALVKEAERLGGTYKAAILIGDLGDQNAIARRDGFFDVVNEHPDLIEVVARISTEWNADVAFSGLTNALQANPDINFLVTSSDFLHPQIEQALKVAGKWHKRGEEGHVIFGGFDGDEGGYERLADGYLDAVGVQNVFFEVDLALNALEATWNGEPVEGPLLDPGFVITPANMEEMQEEMWGYHVWKSQQ